MTGPEDIALTHSLLQHHKTRSQLPGLRTAAASIYYGNPSNWFWWHVCASCSSADLALSSLDRKWRRTPVRSILYSNMPPRLVCHYLRNGNVKSIPVVGS